MTAVRVERDLLGECELPVEALHGVHTRRAVANFPGRGPRLREIDEFVTAFAMVKLAAARANRECGVLEPQIAEAIAAACQEMAEGDPAVRVDLVVPIVQGGAGTSTNMNVNEVVANRALQLLGHSPGEYAYCHPNDHVNRSQSTNDVYPTALRLALLLRHEATRNALTGLAGSLDEAARRYAHVPKLARTQLRDAVPMKVGQEFQAWADGCRAAVVGLDDARRQLLSVNLGGTAVGTGLGAPAGFGSRAVRHLAIISGLGLRPALRPVSATTDTGGLLGYSAALRGASVRVAKIANDLRLLSSGPRAGLGELELPAVQAGSSMMPGKVNPVIPEYVNQLCYQVHGLDHTVTMALDAAQLQLSPMLPAAAAALFEAQALVADAATALARRCVEGIRVDVERVRAYAGDGLGELSAAATVLGYDKTSRLAVQAARAGQPPAAAVRGVAAAENSNHEPASR